MRIVATCLLLAALVGASGLATGQASVQVVGLFPGAAVVVVDGQRKMLREGETGPAGVQVLRVDRDGALLRIGGVERQVTLGRDYGGGYAAPTRQQLAVAQGAGGHYWVAGSVNGQSAQFLVDTGATSVAMNEAHARRLGIDYRVSGVPLTVSTASGTARAWKVRLNSVKVGGIEVLGVEAVVVEGGAPTEMLLGMSYLSRVSWREDQGVLRLEAKF